MLTLAQPFLKRSLLSYAIAVAAAGFVSSAMADGITISIGGGIFTPVILDPVKANTCGEGVNPDGSGTAIPGFATGTYCLAANGRLYFSADSFAPTAYSGQFTIPGEEPGIVNNSGRLNVLSDDASDYPALYIEGHVSASVINGQEGIIGAVANANNARAFGLIILDGASGLVSNNGSISAAAAATNSAEAFALLVGATVTGTLSNSGLIVALADAINGNSRAYGILVHALELAAPLPAMDDMAPARIINSGAIIARSGSINGQAQPHAYGIGVGNLGAGTTIQNTGLIAADVLSEGEAYGIIVGTGSGMVDNGGLIFGGVALGGSNNMSGVSLNNAGGILTRLGNNSYVSGTYTQAAGGWLAFELKDTSHYSRIIIGGTANFTASQNIFVPINGTPQFSDHSVFTDVISAGTLNATSFTVSDPSMFWSFTAAIDGNTVDLTAHKVASTEVLAGSGLVFSPSLTALIDSVIAEGSAGDHAELAATLNTASSASAVAKIIKQLEPEMHGVAATRVAATGVANALGSHIADTRGASSGDAFKDAAVWVKPFFGKAEQDAVNGVSGYDVDSSGFLIGLDGAVSDAVRVGVAYAGAHSNVDDSAGTKMDINTMQFVAYGTYAMNSNAVLDMNFGWASNEYTNHRVAGNAIALANYKGTQLSAAAEFSYRYQLSDKIVFIPALAARFNQINIDAYRETGAGMFNLSPLETEENSVLLTAKAGFEWSIGKAGTVLANAGVSSNSSDAASVTSSLSANGPTYVVNGIEPDSVLISGGVGYRYVTSKRLAVTAAYDVEASSSFMANTVSVKVNMPF